MDNSVLFKEVMSGKINAPFVIAEIGQAHEGSLGQALSYIEAVAEAGVNAVKFQTHIADEESSKYDDFRVRVFPQDNTRSDYWKRMEFTPSQWKMLAKRASECGILFLSSPFSNRAVDVLMDCGMEAWKIASGELQNYPMLDKILETKLPLMISTGMSSWQEIDEVYEYTKGVERVLFQCTTAYPSQPENIGLNNIALFQNRYKDCIVGLSDHSGDIYPSMSAYIMGARVFEVHVAWSKSMFGPDTKASLTIYQLKSLVKYLHQQNVLISSPIEKDEIRMEKSDLVTLFGRGIYAREDIEAGHTIEYNELAYLKPAKGVKAKYYKSVIGSVAKNKIIAGEPVLASDLVWKK